MIEGLEPVDPSRPVELDVEAPHREMHLEDGWQSSRQGSAIEPPLLIKGCPQMLTTPMRHCEPGVHRAGPAHARSRARPEPVPQHPRSPGGPTRPRAEPTAVLAGEEAPSPIQPGTNEIVWNSVGLFVIVLLSTLVIGSVIYVLRTRRAAQEALERAATAERAVDELRRERKTRRPLDDPGTDLDVKRLRLEQDRIAMGVCRCS